MTRWMATKIRKCTWLENPAEDHWYCDLCRKQACSFSYTDSTQLFRWKLFSCIRIPTFNQQLNNLCISGDTAFHHITSSVCPPFYTEASTASSFQLQNFFTTLLTVWGLHYFIPKSSPGLDEEVPGTARIVSGMWWMSVIKRRLDFHTTATSTLFFCGCAIRFINDLLG